MPEFEQDFLPVRVPAAPITSKKLKTNDGKATAQGGDIIAPECPIMLIEILEFVEVIIRVSLFVILIFQGFILFGAFTDIYTKSTASCHLDMLVAGVQATPEVACCPSAQTCAGIARRGWQRGQANCRPSLPTTRDCKQHERCRSKQACCLLKDVQPESCDKRYYPGRFAMPGRSSLARI